jgi:5'-nucleotidase
VNDVYQIEPDARGRGGLARVATLVRELRRETPHTLLVLAGDTLSPSLYSTFFRGRQMIEAWNAVGLDIAIFGNHEFDFGPAVLIERMRESAFAWLATNVLDRDTGRPFGGAARWLRRELDGVRMGLVGLTTLDTAVMSSAGPDVIFRPPEREAEAAFAEMGPVDLRVAVTHLELREDRALAARVPLDVILGGHDHEPLVEEEGPALILKAGADAVNVGQVIVQVGCGAGPIARRHALLPVDERIAPAPEVAAIAARYAAQADRELDVPLTRTPVALDGREGVVRARENPLGRFIAEAMRERLGADVGLLNGGAIRGNRLIPAGPLTRRDFRALLPFENTLVLLEVTGAALAQALERSVAALPRPAGHFLHTAGLRFEVDPDRPPGRRVSGIEVRGVPVDPDRSYRVAVPDFLGRGGDGYAMLARSRVLVSAEHGPGLIDTVFRAFEAGRSP